MKLWLLTSVLVIGLHVSQPSLSEEIWKIASLNWEPYSSASMTTQGNAIQKLRTLLKQRNITLLVDFYPWERAKRVARSEEYVGYFPAWPEEVLDGFVASPTIDWSWIGVLKRADKGLEFRLLEELFTGYKVGMVSSYVYPEEIMQFTRGSEHNIVYAPNEISLLKMLVAGRQDFAITDPNAMIYLSERDGIGEIELVKTLLQKELVIAMRDGADNQHRIELINELLQDDED
ncbi:hypothetical protein [Motiliproteus coralliicola]|uniref:hypothetical protein n=1 Tax=Motiliproteus coralliicola TaxID=2283196 RepID=UPI001058B5E2|nr:hypothetical protein [Motiliproteus coralliicola]